ncbi:hypothetical protein QE152_g16972 [Popillia japonica]|uniref:Transposable element P transposase-like GTP-binding insertion domain-containing protein n=1 Tax=Popillia japonica TaxID=7064 RepID=A0AAW1L367_POPJA
MRKNTEFRGMGFEIQNEEIVPLFDPPHLLKGIRNNFLEHDATYLYNGKRQVATWNDIVKLYEMDVGDDDTKMCNKLSDVHIYKDKIKKMKVSLAAQVFSRTVSAVMRGIITHGSTTLPRSAMDTADFLLFFNKLFDSVNGTALVVGLPGNLKYAATKDSPHLNFWPKAVKTLEFIPPSLKHWKHTIRGFHYLWQKLQKVGVHYFPTRSCVIYVSRICLALLSYQSTYL